MMATQEAVKSNISGKTVRFRLMLPRYFNPLMVYVGVWTTVYLLYAWRISDALIFDAEQALGPIAILLGTYLLPAVVIAFAAKTVGVGHDVREIDVEQLKRRLFSMLAFWGVVNVVQIGYSGGLPLIWLLIGRSGVSYFDFGIPSVNGMIFALGLAMGMIAFLIYELTGEKKWLNVVLLMVGWGIVSISRKFFVVTLIQTGILYLIVHRVSITTILKFSFGMLLAVLLFGFVGDIRTGRDVILKYAYLNIEYPDWLPSGFVWIYMYLTTPVNNIVNIFVNISPEWNYSFARTFSGLLPSVVRDSDAATSEKYWLISDVFNVSTAYASAYIDVGTIGVTMFNMIISFLTAGLYFFARSLAGKMMFVVFVQALFLTVFNDNFTNLNNCFQVFFIYWAFRGIEGPADVAATAKRG